MTTPPPGNGKDPRTMAALTFMGLLIFGVFMLKACAPDPVDEQKEKTRTDIEHLHPIQPSR